MGYWAQKYFIIVFGCAVFGALAGYADDDIILSGRVINLLTENPVNNVRVEIVSAGKVIMQLDTDITGHFTAAGLPDDGPYSLSFSKRGFNDVHFTSVRASTWATVVKLEPRYIVTPGTPRARANPYRIFVDWPANPETTLKGYNLYRVVVDEEGFALTAPIRLNGAADTLLGDLIETNQFIDESDALEPGQYYCYQVQAVCVNDRMTELSPRSLPVRFGSLMLRLPDSGRPDPSKPTFRHPVSGKHVSRIPVILDCAYDVSTWGMRLEVLLPDHVFSTAPGDEIIVVPSGSIINADFSYAYSFESGFLRVLITVEESTESFLLYGGGALFNIYAVPLYEVEFYDCLPMSFGANTQLYDPFGEPMVIEFEQGWYCPQTDCIMGDANNSGEVNIQDAAAMIHYILGLASIPHDNPCFPEVLDLNLDGRLDSADVMLLLQWIVGLVLPIPNPHTRKGDDADAEETLPVSVWLETLTDEGIVEAQVIIEGADNFSGCSMLIGYPADYLTISKDQVTPGEQLSGPHNPFRFDKNLPEPTEGAENGYVKILTSRETPEDFTAPTLLARLMFTAKNGGYDPDMLPPVITEFSYSDSAAHVPQHTDPRAPDIAKSAGPAAALFATVLRSDNNTPITSAIVSIAPRDFADVSDNVRGVYAMPALPGAKSYTVKAVAPRYEPKSSAIYVGRSETRSVTLHLQPVAEPEGEGEVPREGEGESPREGEGEPPKEGEGEHWYEGEPGEEGEGEKPDEGEPPNEGEGEPPKRRFIISCGQSDTPGGTSLPWTRDLLPGAALATLLLLQRRRAPHH